MRLTRNSKIADSDPQDPNPNYNFSLDGRMINAS